LIYKTCPSSTLLADGPTPAQVAIMKEVAWKAADGSRENTVSSLVLFLENLLCNAPESAQHKHKPMFPWLCPAGLADPCFLQGRWSSQ